MVLRFQLFLCWPVEPWTGQKPCFPFLMISVALLMIFWENLSKSLTKIHIKLPPLMNYGPLDKGKELFWICNLFQNKSSRLRLERSCTQEHLLPRPEWADNHFQENKSHCLLLPAILLDNNQSITLSAMIDSGCEKNLIDYSLVQQMSIEVVPLSSLLCVLALSGNALPQIKQRARPIQLTISGNHSESISCLFFPLLILPCSGIWMVTTAQPSSTGLKCILNLSCHIVIPLVSVALFLQVLHWQT